MSVTGLGLVTPAGIGVEASWQGVLAGQGLATADPALAGLAVTMSCRVPGFDADALLGRKASRRLDRFVQLAVVAAREAVADAGLDPATWDGARVGVVVGCGMGGAATWEQQHAKMLADGPSKVSPLLIPMLVPNMVAGQLAMDLQALGPNLVTATACASGATAIGVARDLLRSGACDIVLAGGTEAGLTPLSIAGFAQMGALSTRNEDPGAASRPFDAGRNGFVAAEAAGMLVLERAADAQARGANVRAMLAGYGASADGHHITAPDPHGSGASRAMTAAIEDAGLTPRDIVHVNAHGTSTPLNDAAEAAAITALFGTPGPPVTSIKGVVGHPFGAAGALEAAAAALTIDRRSIPPTAGHRRLDPAMSIDVVAGRPRPFEPAPVLSNSFAFGGHNGCLVLGPPT